MNMSAPGAGPRLAGLIVGAVGLALAIAGTLVMRYSPGAIAARHAGLSALPSPSASGLTDTPPGTEVLVDGRIAADQPRRFRDFVAFVKEEEETDRNDRDRKEWKVRDRQAPPLRIVLTDDDAVRVVNHGYGLWGAKTTWSDHTFGRETRYTGIVVDEPVVVHARAVAGGLEAIEVASGTRATYLQAIQDSIGTAWWIGVLFSTIGGALLVVALILFTVAVRIRRRSGVR
jgi:hypothetical protein